MFCSPPSPPFFLTSTPPPRGIFPPPPPLTSPSLLRCWYHANEESILLHAPEIKHNGALLAAILYAYWVLKKNLFFCIWLPDLRLQDVCVKFDCYWLAIFWRLKRDLTLKIFRKKTQFFGTPCFNAYSLMHRAELYDTLILPDKLGVNKDSEKQWT